jgi:predicted nucleic acid-binding protein
MRALRKRVKPDTMSVREMTNEGRRFCFVALLERLSILQEGQWVRESVSNVVPLARDYSLSAYDAAYLELAIRHTVPLATLERDLRTAAKRAGLRILG